MNASLALDPAARRRAACARLRAFTRWLRSSRRWGVGRASAWLRERLGLTLDGWHRLTNPRRALVPVLALQRLERLTVEIGWPGGVLRAGEWI